jgi:hypothetical protein
LLAVAVIEKHREHQVTSDPRWASSLLRSDLGFRYTQVPSNKQLWRHLAHQAIDFIRSVPALPSRAMSVLGLGHDDAWSEVTNSAASPEADLRPPLAFMSTRSLRLRAPRIPSVSAQRSPQKRAVQRSGA